jgi:hypothetical protein
MTHTSTICPCTGWRSVEGGHWRHEYTDQRRPARVLTSTHTASTRMLPFTIICQ